MRGTVRLLSIEDDAQLIADTFNYLLSSTEYTADHVRDALLGWIWFCGYAGKWEALPDTRYLLTLHIEFHTICLPVEAIEIDGAPRWLLSGEIGNIPFAEHIYLALAAEGLCTLEHSRPEVVLPVYTRLSAEAGFRTFGKPARHRNKWSNLKFSTFDPDQCVGTLLDFMYRNLYYHAQKYLVEHLVDPNAVSFGDDTDEWAVKVNVDGADYCLPRVCRPTLGMNFLMATYERDLVAIIEYRIYGDTLYWINTFPVRSEHMLKIGLGNACIYELYKKAKVHSLRYVNLGFDANSYKIQSYAGSIIRLGLAPAAWDAPLPNDIFVACKN